MNRQGLSVHLEAKISLDMEGHEFDFAVIQLLTIFRLSQELATRLNMSLEEVEDSFVQAACHEASMMSQQQKVDMIARYYGGTPE